MCRKGAERMTTDRASHLSVHRYIDQSDTEGTATGDVGICWRDRGQLMTAAVPGAHEGDHGLLLNSPWYPRQADGQDRPALEVIRHPEHSDWAELGCRRETMRH
jgi:hypothetical protein